MKTDFKEIEKEFIERFEHKLIEKIPFSYHLSYGDEDTTCLIDGYDERFIYVDSVIKYEDVKKSNLHQSDLPVLILMALDGDKELNAYMIEFEHLYLEKLNYEKRLYN